MPAVYLPPTLDWKPIYRERSIVGSYGWGDKALRIPDIHERGVKGAGIRIGIIDTGKSRHPDLKYAEAWTVIPRDDGIDRAGHGSHVASIIRRAAPLCEMVSVKALDDNGGGDTAGIAKAIRLCVDRGCRIINCSLGGGKDQAVLDAIEYARSKGCFVIAAAGNSGGAVEWPAKHEDTFAIGSSKATGEISDFSCRGNEIDGAAPGEDITGCGVDTGYVSMSGTSMAAPLYSGVTGLLIDAQAQAKAAGKHVVDPVVDSDSLNRHIERHSTDQGERGRDSSWGWGIPTISFVFNGIEDKTSAGVDEPTFDLGPFYLNFPAKAGDLFSGGLKA